MCLSPPSLNFLEIKNKEICGGGVRDTTPEDPDTLTPHQRCARIWVRMATFDGCPGAQLPIKDIGSKVKRTIQRTGADVCMGYRENNRSGETG